MSILQQQMGKWPGYAAHPTTYYVLGGSMGFFLYKGIQYAFLGRLLPLALVLVIGVLLLRGRNASPKALRRTIRVWVVLLVLWGGFRVLMAVVDRFVQPFTENHLHEQLSWGGSLLSVLAVAASIYLFRTVKRLT